MKFTEDLNIKNRRSLQTRNVGKSPRSKKTPQNWGKDKREGVVTLEEFQKNSCEGGGVYGN